MKAPMPSTSTNALSGLDAGTFRRICSVDELCESVDEQPQQTAAPIAIAIYASGKMSVSIYKEVVGHDSDGIELQRRTIRVVTSVPNSDLAWEQCAEFLVNLLRPANLIDDVHATIRPFRVCFCVFG